MKKLTSFILLIGLCLMILTGCDLNSEEYSLQDKITEEIKYTENKLVGIVNSFASGSYLENANENTENNTNINEDNTVDVIETNNIFKSDKVLEDTRDIEEASNILMVDLATQNIDNDEITRFSDGINKMISVLSTNDENQYLIELNNVFSLLPNFEAKVSNDSDEIFERRLKYFTISSYIAFAVDDKELAKTQVNTLESEFLEKQKNIEYVEEHKYNLNKIYLLIEELKKGIESDREEIVKEKYLLLIDEI